MILPIDVFPELCRDIRDKMKWNVVGYTGHKEYALDGPKTVLEKLLKRETAVMGNRRSKIIRVV